MVPSESYCAGFFTESYCAGVSNKHCLLTFFILTIFSGRLHKFYCKLKFRPLVSQDISAWVLIIPPAFMPKRIKFFLFPFFPSSSRSFTRSFVLPLQ